MSDELPDLHAEAIAAQKVLFAFLMPGADPRVLTQALRPRDEDYGLVFRSDIAEGLRSTYTELWGTNPVIQRKSHQTALIARACPASAFVQGNPMMSFFPGGYAGIAEYLQPDRIWVAWKFVAGGETIGMAYEGLVKLDDRFVWFPRPYIVLRKL